MTDDGTDILFAVLADGRLWETLATHRRDDHLDTAPDLIGILATSASSSKDATLVADWFRVD